MIPFANFEAAARIDRSGFFWFERARKQPLLNNGKSSEAYEFQRIETPFKRHS